MDALMEKFVKQNTEYQAKLDADPLLKERRENAEAHRCPKRRARLEKSCVVLFGKGVGWLQNPSVWMCERCWERAQNTNLEGK